MLRRSGGNQQTDWENYDMNMLEQYRKYKDKIKLLWKRDCDLLENELILLANSFTVNPQA